MNEALLIQKAKKELTKNGGFAWSGSAWSDIFHIFDILYISPGGLYTSYFQVSTQDHRWARLNKINKWKREYGGLPERSFLMLWNYKLNAFEIEPLT